MLKIKKTLQRIGFIVLGIILFVLVYFTAAWGLSRLQTASINEKTKQPITCYIKSNGVHTDIVVPVKTVYKDWSEDFPFSHTRSADTQCNWLGVGWGDKGFYLETPTWDDLTFKTAFKAAFALSTSALHATYYKSMEEHEHCYALRLSPRQYQYLIRYIENAVQHRVNGKPIHIITDAVYGNNDAFYEAVGSYSMFHTCNTWTNNALKVCEQKAAWWTPFDWGILDHYR